MRVGIMTFQETTNYGALLQTIALHLVLKSKNVDSEIIRYRCENIVKRELPESIFANGLLHAPISLVSKSVQTKKYKKFEQFKNSNCVISEKEYDRGNIKEADACYDRFIVGSDIVWELNVTGGDTAYYLDFVTGKERKYSFSSSFGYDRVPAEYEDVTKKLLSDFSAISVRENEGAKIIKELLGQDVPVTVDPTLLLNGNEWRSYEKSYKVNKPYVLVYFDDEGRALNFAKKLAEENKLNVVFVRNSLRVIPGVTTVRDASVEQFLWLIDNATYVVTASYHGVLFSINFNTPFYFYNRAHFGRINTIVSKLGLENRDIKTGNYSVTDINWDKVNESVEVLRAASMERLNFIFG